MALKSLSCLDTDDFNEVQRHFLNVAQAAHPENGGNKDDFFIACASWLQI